MWLAAKQAERLAVARIEGNRLFQQRLRHHIVRPRQAPVMRQRAHQQIPGVHVVGRLALGAEAFGGIELRLDRGDDRLRDLVLHGEHIRKAAVVALGPDVAAGRDIVELGGDPHMVAFLADRALDDVADAKLLADLLQMHGFAAVDEGGVAGDDVEPAQFRQRGDDVLADAFGKIFLLGLAAHVGERQHRDRRAIERGKMRARRLGGGLRWRSGRRLCGDSVARGHAVTLHADVAYEAKAFARDGADQVLGVAGVADGLARGVDAGGQGGFGDDAAAPDVLDQIILADDMVAVLSR